MEKLKEICQMFRKQDWPMGSVRVGQDILAGAVNDYAALEKRCEEAERDMDHNACLVDEADELTMQESDRADKAEARLAAAQKVVDAAEKFYKETKGTQCYAKDGEWEGASSDADDVLCDADLGEHELSCGVYFDVVADVKSDEDPDYTSVFLKESSFDRLAQALNALKEHP